jgi:GAF domain-containing protein
MVFQEQDLRDIRPHSGAIIKGGLAGTVSIGGRRAFALLVGRASAEPGDDSWMRLFQGLLKHVQLLVENAYLQGELGRLRREATELRQVSVELAHIQGLNMVLEFIVQKVCELLDAEISYIALADSGECVVRVVATHGACSNELMGLSHRYGEGVGGRVALSRKPLLVNNWFEDITPRPIDAARILAVEGIVSAICVPMLTRSGLVGVLYAASRREAAFSKDQLESLERLAMDAAAAIETARLFEEQHRAVADLNESIAINERFLSLVLRDGGLQAIANALAAVVGYPAMIEDRLGCIMAHAQPQSIDAELAMDAAVSSRDILTRPGSYHDLQRIAQSRKVVDIAPRPDLPEGSCPRLIAPVVAGRDALGYVTLLGLTAPG